jgi:hypothetical protein
MKICYIKFKLYEKICIKEHRQTEFVFIQLINLTIKKSQV